jgi:hypothetical protein
MTVAGVVEPCQLHRVSSGNGSDEGRWFGKVVGRRVSVALEAAKSREN